MQVDTALITMVAAGIAAWMKQRGEAKKAAARAAAQPPAAAAQATAGEDERTRKVQEEVRRKIAARRAGVPPVAASPVFRELPPSPPLAAPRPVSRPWEGRMTELFGAPPAKVLPPPKSIPPAILPPIDAGLPPPIAAQEAYAPPVPSSAPAESWLSALRDPGGIRRAVVLREILGAPVGLR